MKDEAGAPVADVRELIENMRFGWRFRSVLITASLLVVALLIGASIMLVKPALLLGVLATVIVIAVVALHPPFAAFLVIGVTPLIAGIDRSSLIPLLRPNEALALIVACGLVAGGLVRARTGSFSRWRIDALHLSIIAMVLAGSLIPLAWLVARGHSIESDDVLYALDIWKLYGLYLIVRFSVRTERDIQRCLWIAMIAASGVAVVAILQSLQLFGITRFLAAHYAPFGEAAAVNNNRGGSTLALPVAVADLLTFNLAIAVGFLLRGSRRRVTLLILSIVFVAGILAAAEFSGVIALVLGMITIGVVTRKLRPLATFIPISIGAAFPLRAVVEKRLSGFQSASGLPVSWTGRLSNLRGYFWPRLFSGLNWVLGVRPSARVVSPTSLAGYVWIESGYTWLLWAGGLPFLASFVWFTWIGLRRGLEAARSRVDSIGVAGLALVVTLAVVAVLMIIDPHLTYRGSGDLLFSLLALVSVGVGIQKATSRPVDR